MAISINQLNAFTRSHIIPKVVDNIYNSNVLLYKLMKEKAKRWPGGTYFETELVYAKNTNVGPYGNNADLSPSAEEEFTKTQFSPVRYNAGIVLEGLDMAINKGAHQVVNLASEKVKNAEKSLKDSMADDLFNTTQSNAFTGLHTICEADGGSGSALGGVTGGPNGDASEWLSSSGSEGRANGPDATTTTLTKTVLDKHYNSCKMDNDHPDILFTTDDIWSGIMTTFLMPNMRYTDTKLADLGFENFKYRKSYAFGDDKCDAGDLFFLNSEHLYFAVFSKMNFKFIPWTYETASKDRWVAHIRWYGNLICDERRKQGWMSAITTVS